MARQLRLDETFSGAATRDVEDMCEVVNLQKESYDVYIGRPSRFANPWRVGDHGDRGTVVKKFRNWISSQETLMRFARTLLPGTRLGCFCVPNMCHGHLLAEIAEGEWDDVIPQAPVFVFGSNLAGKHGRGAAQVASQRYGAQKGVARGPTGNAYAVPTKDETLQSLSLPAILAEIDSFLEYAPHRPDLRFKVTRVGCGLAGANEEAVRARFLESGLDNLILPASWVGGNGVIVAGSRNLTPNKLGRDRMSWIYEKLDRVLSRLDGPEIVSGAAQGIDSVGEQYAADRGLPIQRFPAAWEWHGRAAGVFRNAEMAHYAPRLVAFKTPDSKGTQNMIDQMRAVGGDVRVFEINP